MVDTSTPHGMWFERLAGQLHDRRTGRAGAARWNRGALDNKVERPPLEVLDAYFRGDPPLRSDIHSGWKPYVRAFLRAGRFNIAEKTVTSKSNRMELRDFRTSAADDEMGDTLARDIMRANELEIVSTDTHDLMLGLGAGYVLTQPATDGSKFGRATKEDPRQVITAHDALTGATLAGLKMYRDEWDAADHAYIALRLESGAVAVQKLICKGRSTLTSGRFRLDADRWELDGEEQDSPFKIMPFVRFQNRYGVGEFERHLDTLDRINDKIFNEWWIAKIQAFRQRAVENLPDTQPVQKPDGTVVEEEIDYTDMFTASPDEMWRVPEGVKFWESSTVDMTPITNAVQKDLERYATAVNLPLHTITPDAANGSAEGATLMREEHIFTVGDRIRRVRRPWATVMGNLFAFTDDTDYQARRDVTQIEAMFGPAERYSLEQMSSAASQLREIYPIEGIWTDVMQRPPADVERLRTLKGRDRLYAAGGGAPAPAAPTLPVFQPPAAP